MKNLNEDISRIKTMMGLSEQKEQPPINKDEEIKKLGLTLIDQTFKKYGFQRNDTPQKIRSIHQLVVTYDKKPSYSGNISEDGEAGIRILVPTPLKDTVLQNCNSKTHDLDKNYILLNNNNVECVLSKLAN